jgi:membrane-associated phospholipid phosphatase/MFS family permease
MAVARLRPGPALPAGAGFLAAFAAVALGVGLGRAITTTYLPVLLDRIKDAPALIGAIMLVNAAAGLVVPLVVGVWSDRRGGRRLPFIVGGTALTAGGLAAIALGQASSYLALGLAAALTYTGLNAALTAHRAVIAEGFPDARRPAATSAEELAMLVGGMLGVVAGGALIDASPAVLFAGTALVLPLLAAPTLLVLRGRARTRSVRAEAIAQRLPLREAARSVPRAARLVLGAQVLWVLAYAALPAFFILYADRVLALDAAASGAILAAFGVLTGAGMVVAGRTPPERVHRRLGMGAALLGSGLLAAAPADTVAAAAIPFAAAAVGMGLVSGLGFPYFARFIPDAHEGSYSGLYFAVRGIASAIALPVAGLLIAVTGSYRVLLVQAGAALLALIPLARAEALRNPPAPAPLRPAPRRLGAVVPCLSSARLPEVVARTLAHADVVAVVDDGAAPALPDDPRVVLVRPGPPGGKGTAVAAGVAALLGRPDPPEAIVVLDADGQHPPECIPGLVEAARGADVVLGDRRDDRRSMPRTRRTTNALSSALLALVLRRRMRDSQCGMRLYWADALERVPLPDGRYEAETVHLKAAVRAGLRVAWAPIPAVYEGEASAFRPVADTARVLAAILGLHARAPGRAFGRLWSGRLAALVAGTLLLAACTPLLAGLDHRGFTAINALGAGPTWVYEALDPHSRNYVLLCLLAVVTAAAVRGGRAGGTALAVLVAALFSDVLVQAVYLLYDRPRPEEVLSSAQVLLVEGRSWAHIASFPSGHLVVTTAIAVAAMSAVPRLRGLLWAYVAAIALTRITFGAHFPLDVAAGLVFGAVVGRFSAALAHAMGLLGPPAPLVARTGALPLPVATPALAGAQRAADPQARDERP